MSKEMRDQLVGWIEEIVRNHYAGKVALVCLYGSHINGTANEHSDVDCYFVPKTEEGMALARTFLLEGVGYDLFPMPWQRLEAIARLEQSHQPLVGDVQVLYADSTADLEKLEAVRRQLRDNLADPVFRQRAARERFVRACSRLPLADDDLKTARLKAGGLLMDVAEVFAFGQGEYYHYGLKRQFHDLLALPQLPEGLGKDYLAVLKAKTSAEIAAACRSLLERCPWPVMQNQQPVAWGDRPAAEQLVGLYEEISSTFLKIYRCAEIGDPVLAFLSAVCLQWELPWVDLLTSYRYEDLTPMAENARAVETQLRRELESAGVGLKEYKTFAEFEQAQKESGIR
jgi:predicted nucleotidyltransferase